MKDPYVYPGTNVLINKLNIRNEIELEEKEKLLTLDRILEGIPKGNYDLAHYQAIHKHVFQNLYSWAGQIRTVSISKGNDLFASPAFIIPAANKVFKKLHQENILKNLSQEYFAKRAAYYFNEVNAVHPFREGNGRTQRLLFDAIAKEAGYEFSWHNIKREPFLTASINGFHGNHKSMEDIFLHIVTPETKSITNSRKDDEQRKELEFKFLQHQLEKAKLDNAYQHVAKLEKDLTKKAREIQADTPHYARLKVERKSLAKQIQQTVETTLLKQDRGYNRE